MGFDGCVSKGIFSTVTAIRQSYDCFSGGACRVTEPSEGAEGKGWGDRLLGMLC